MNNALPKLVSDILRCRCCCLCLSPLSNSFKWGIFANNLLPNLRRKGEFERNVLHILIPLSALNYQSAYNQYEFDYETSAGYAIHICVIFLKHDRQGLDNLAFCVMIADRANSYEMFEDYYTKCLKELMRKMFVMNICFVTETSQSINHELKNMMDVLSDFKNVDIAFSMMVLSGHEFGINSLDSEYSIYNKIKHAYSSYSPFEVNINTGLTITNIVDIFGANHFILKDGLDKLSKELENCIRMLDWMKIKIELDFDPDGVEMSPDWMRNTLDECLCDTNTGIRYIGLMESLSASFVTDVYSEYSHNCGKHKNINLYELLSSIATQKIHNICINTIKKIHNQ